MPWYVSRKQGLTLMAQRASSLRAHLLASSAIAHCACRLVAHVAHELKDPTRVQAGGCRILASHPSSTQQASALAPAWCCVDKRRIYSEAPHAEQSISMVDKSCSLALAARWQTALQLRASARQSANGPRCDTYSLHMHCWGICMASARVCVHVALSVCTLTFMLQS